jgi:hypothetical protein
MINTHQKIRYASLPNGFTNYCIHLKKSYGLFLYIFQYLYTHFFPHTRFNHSHSTIKSLINEFLGNSRNQKNEAGETLGDHKPAENEKSYLNQERQLLKLAIIGGDLPGEALAKPEALGWRLCIYIGRRRRLIQMQNNHGASGLNPEAPWT